MRDRLFLLGAVVLALVPYRDFFSERVPVARDLLLYFYPLKAHLAEALASGHLPWIDRFRWGGVPLLSNPGAGAFYPANLLFLVLPLGTAMKVWTLLHLAIAVTGFAALGRRWDLSPRAAAVLGLGFGLSGTMVSLAPFPTTYSALSLAPWMAAFAIDAARTAGKGPVARLAAAATLVILASNPEAALHAAALAGLAALPTLLTPPAPRPRGRAVASLALAGLFAFGLAAPTLLTGLANTSRSVRGPGGGMTVAHAGQKALPAVRLPELVLDGAVADWVTMPFAAGVDGYPYLPSLTPGRVAVALALLGLALGGSGRLRALALVVGGVLLALGPATPVWVLAAKVAPLIGKMRYPEKHAALYGLGMLWLAALGLRALEQRARPHVLRFALPALALAVLLDRDRVAGGLSFTDSPAVLTRAPAVLGPMAGAKAPTPPRVFHRDQYLEVPFRYFVETATTVRAQRESALPFYPSLFGIGHTFDRDYDLTLPVEVIEWERLFPKALASGSPVPLRILRAAGVAAVVHTEVDGFRREPKLELLPAPLPPFRFVSRVATDPDARRLFRQLLEEGCDPDTAYVQEPAGEVPERPAAGRVVALSDSPHELRLDVDVDGPGPGFLSLYRLRDAAREATLDGRPLEVSGAGFGFAGVTVPAGRHTLRLRPETRWVRIGALISAASALVLLGGLLFRR